MKKHAHLEEKNYF